MSLSEISNILWRERRLLELLAFKLEEEHLVLSSGRTRWLARASREVDVIIDEIKHVRLERAIRMADSSDELGLSGTPTLRELANSVEPPWSSIFSEHGRALHTLAREIESITRVGMTPAAALGEIDIAGDDVIGIVPDRSPVLRLVDDEL
jgi:FlgN protein